MKTAFENVLITVIVPVYKVEAYLKRCVDSIISQTYRNLEIILVDDGSPDKCGEICDQYAQKDPRIIVIHKKNGGLSDARNAALDVCTGEYIAYVDSDDHVEPEYIEYLYALICENNAQISICDYEYVSEGGGYLKHSIDDDCEWIFDRKKAIEYYCSGKLFPKSAWCKLFHRSCFDNLRFPVGKIFEDIPTIYRALTKADRVVYGRKALYCYLYRVGAISKQKFSLSRMDAVYFIDAVCQEVIRDYPDLTGVCSRMQFEEYSYVFKEIVKSGSAHRDLERELYRKIKKVRMYALREGLNKKMLFYCLGSFGGIGVMRMSSKIETFFSRKRV